MNDPKNLLAKQADIDDQWWHFVLLFPVIVNGFLLINYSLYIQEDSIMFNLSTGDEESAIQLVERIYDVSPGSGQDARTIVNQLKKQVKKKDNKINKPNYCEGLFSRQNWWGTFVLAYYASMM